MYKLEGKKAGAPLRKKLSPHPLSGWPGINDFLLTNSKNPLENTLDSSKKIKHLEALSSNPNVVELDPAFGDIPSHLKRYVQFLREHLIPKDGTKMSGQSLLESVIRAIRAFGDVSFPTPFY